MATISRVASSSLRHDTIPPHNFHIRKTSLSFSSIDSLKRIVTSGGRRLIVAASPPTEDAVVATHPLTKQDLIDYLASGCKTKDKWRCVHLSFFFIIFNILFIISFKLILIFNTCRYCFLFYYS